MTESLKDRVTASMKDAMRAKAKERLKTIRMLLAAIKQYEIDKRVDIDEPQTLAIVEKLIKRCKDSLQQFRDAERADLAEREEADIAILEEFMPQQLPEEAILAAVEAAIAETGAASVRDMGAVMKLLKPQLQGQADMGVVSGLVRGKLQ